jgi:hypothetical protein
MRTLQRFLARLLLLARSRSVRHTMAVARLSSRKPSLLRVRPTHMRHRLKLMLHRILHPLVVTPPGSAPTRVPATQPCSLIIPTSPATTSPHTSLTVHAMNLALMPMFIPARACCIFGSSHQHRLKSYFRFGTVYLCPVFWQVSNTGTDSRAGTLIHESSHFTANGGTQDYVYGQSSAKSLASSNPDEAVFNADNHEYFAENNPALS